MSSLGPGKYSIAYVKIDGLSAMARAKECSAHSNYSGDYRNTCSERTYRTLDMISTETFNACATAHATTAPNLGAEVGNLESVISQVTEVKITYKQANVIEILNTLPTPMENEVNACVLLLTHTAGGHTVYAVKTFDGSVAVVDPSVGVTELGTPEEISRKLTEKTYNVNVSYVPVTKVGDAESAQFNGAVYTPVTKRVGGRKKTKRKKYNKRSRRY
jgi:hypothetical protein